MLNEREQAAHDPAIAETAQGLSLAFEKLKADISQSRAARFVLAVLEKLKGAIQMEKTLKTGKIGQFGAESRVTYGGVKWVVLDAPPEYVALSCGRCVEGRKRRSSVHGFRHGQ